MPFNLRKHIGMTMKNLLTLLFSLFLCASLVQAWSPKLQDRSAMLRIPRVSSNLNSKGAFDPLELCHPHEYADPPVLKGLLLSSVALVSSPSVVSAATAFTPNALPSALAAYGHFVSLMGMIACVTVERFTIKPNMSDEEEDRIAIADTLFGVFGAILAYTGYIRVTQYEKGWEFYSHEPIFWLKILFVGIFGAASFFNTTKIIQRSVDKRNGKLVPMSEKLAKRMIQICNAEIVALAVIPLTASVMARGVAYSNDIPWQVEAAVAALVFGGLSYKYIKDALVWVEDDVPVVQKTD